MTTHSKLEQYGFLWSQLRLFLASLALFGGGTPIAYAFFQDSPFLSSLMRTTVALSWIISGIISIYLLSRWYKHGKTLFGHSQSLDRAAFFVSVVSGFNLGIAGLSHYNIGMHIWSGRFIFIVTGLIYLASAFYLNGRWNIHRRRVW